MVVLKIILFSFAPNFNLGPDFKSGAAFKYNILVGAQSKKMRNLW